MQRLGFWPKNDNAPTLPEQLIKKEGELQRELSTLLQEKRKFEDKEAMLAQMRKKRMEEAKKKREQTKQKREAKRIEKAEKWKASKEKEIIYLGEKVSGGLNAKESDVPALDSKGLPTFTEETELAQAMGITISQLRFFCYHRSVATTTHYKRFGIKKKSGGMRIISAPMPRLKAAQYWVFHNVLNKLRHHEAAHGFVRERSILSNAKEHLNKEVVVNIDLKDFFPSIHFKRVKGLFHKLGYSEKIATIFSLLCTEPDVEEVELDAKTYFVAKGKRALPQGAPTSPAITNLLCYKLDCRLHGVAKAMGLSYTRYADDMTFSGDGEAAAKVQQLLWRLHRIIKDEGFTIHPKKIHVMRKGARQEVTGIVVNKQPGINRQTLHRFRALLNKIEKKGIEGKRWRGGNVIAEIAGYAEFVSMVKPAQGVKFKDQVRRILQQPDVIEHLQKAPLQAVHASHASKPIKDTHSNSDRNESSKPWWDVL
ncbi:MAG: RNA-directed DNA polymerase [Flavobacterium sp.]|nr:MAG: RNA-directed DNA polymerase [Flavobacterium sp.]